VRVRGVTQLRDVVYVVCYRSSRIRTFSSTTHQRLTDINVSGLRHPWDIAGCEQTSHVYVADSGECVWRVSSDGEDVKRWLPKSPSDTFRPYTLSVTSSRLLVTSGSTQQLTLYDADGDELSRVRLPDYMNRLLDYMNPYHAVESPTGTFIVCHRNTQLRQYHVSEVSNEGQVLRQFSGPLGYSPLTWSCHIAIDSQGNIFVADYGNHRILLLDTQLALHHVIIDKFHHGSVRPERLCYIEQSGQLLVVLNKRVAVFDVLQ